MSLVRLDLLDQTLHGHQVMNSWICPKWFDFPLKLVEISSTVVKYKMSAQKQEIENQIPTILIVITQELYSKSPVISGTSKFEFRV